MIDLLRSGCASRGQLCACIPSVIRAVSETSLTERSSAEESPNCPAPTSTASFSRRELFIAAMEDDWRMVEAEFELRSRIHAAGADVSSLLAAQFQRELSRLDANDPQYVPQLVTRDPGCRPHAPTPPTCTWSPSPTRSTCTGESTACCRRSPNFRRSSPPALWRG